MSPLRQSAGNNNCFRFGCLANCISGFVWTAESGCRPLCYAVFSRTGLQCLKLHVYVIQSWKTKSALSRLKIAIRYINFLFSGRHIGLLSAWVLPVFTLLCNLAEFTEYLKISWLYFIRFQRYTETPVSLSRSWLYVLHYYFRYMSTFCKSGSSARWKSRSTSSGNLLKLCFCVLYNSRYDRHNIGTKNWLWQNITSGF